VLRIDRDNTSRKHSLQDLLDQIHSGDPAILVGTQMLAKGHHFADVTLVAILDGDNGMFSADFRSAEKLCQLITQVAGRAGRAEKPGHVLIQTRYSDHPLMQDLVKQDYVHLAQQLLKERELQQLPPWRQQAILRSESEQAETGQKFLRRIRHSLEPKLATEKTIQLIGPLPALMEKRANRYRYELIFSSTQRQILQQLLTQLACSLEQDTEAKKLRWGIDVDPM
jgi:primosomal protein N' (replication factor Y)